MYRSKKVSKSSFIYLALFFNRGYKVLHISLDTGKVKQGHKACIKEINSKIHTQRTYENGGHSETSNRPEHTNTISVDAALK